MPFILFLMMSLSAFAGNRDNLVFVKQDYCVCNDGQAVSYGNCASFCSTKNTNGLDTLFANYMIRENEKYQTVTDWCTKRSTWDFRNPKCVLAVKNEEGTTIELGVVVVGNSVVANVSSIPVDKVQIFTLIEKVSKAKSESAQLVKYDGGIQIPLPVQVGTMNQFTCISKSQNQNFHFYFSPAHSPDAQTAGSDFYCHDVIKYGERDDVMFPRLEEKSAVFSGWPNTSPLFYDNNANGVLDVNDMIRHFVKRFGGTINLGTEFFSYLTLPGNDQLYQQSGASKNSATFTMFPFIDQTTFQSFCPDEAHYNSAAPLFRALKEVVAYPTEGLYAGVRLEDATDVVLLNETDIKSVWFYVKNGQIKVPTDENVSRVSVYFYYPLDKNDPYTKKPHQRPYQVKSAQEIGFATNNTYPTHDRKLACIPKF
jgi:hypothetical protein